MAPLAVGADTPSSSATIGAVTTRWCGTRSTSRRAAASARRSDT